MRAAAIDLGTNSTRMLVADVTASCGLEEVESESRVTRLGAGVDRTGRLADDAIERVMEVLGDYRRRLDALGVERAIGTLTSAGRDADNGAALAELIRERHGIDARLISGDEEARLVYLGATAGRDDHGATVAVVDIGGGSTELAVGAGGRLAGHVSLQAGVLRHSERFLAGDDPPAAAALAALRSDLREMIGTEAGRLAARPSMALAVGGTPKSCASILGDADRRHGAVIGSADCEGLLERLASMPLAERSRVPGLHPARAPAIVAGIALLLETLAALGLDRVEVCEHDLRHGVLLDLAAHGA